MLQGGILKKRLKGLMRQCKRLIKRFLFPPISGPAVERLARMRAYQMDKVAVTVYRIENSGRGKMVWVHDKQGNRLVVYTQNAMMQGRLKHIGSNRKPDPGLILYYGDRYRSIPASYLTLSL